MFASKEPLFDRIACLVVTAGQVQGGVQGLPHVDEILGQGHRLGVAGDGDRPVQVGGSVAVLAVRDTDHGTG